MELPEEQRPLVWPGVSALTPFWQPQPTQPAASTQQTPRFSFDWSRGKRDQPTPLLKTLGSYGNLSRQRELSLPCPARCASRPPARPHTTRHPSAPAGWKHFLFLLSCSGFMFLLALGFFPLVLLRPQKFCVFFSMGSILAMASFAVLRGPLDQLKHMFSRSRLPFTSTYIGSMALTLYAALVLQSYFLVVLCAGIQACSLGWYLMSYIPGGAPILKVATRAGARVLSALCCRRGAASAGSLLPL